MVRRCCMIAPAWLWGPLSVLPLLRAFVLPCLLVQVCWGCRVAGCCCCWAAVARCAGTMDTRGPSKVSLLMGDDSEPGSTTWMASPPGAQRRRSAATAAAVACALPVAPATFGHCRPADDPLSTPTEQWPEPDTSLVSVEMLGVSEGASGSSRGWELREMRALLLWSLLRPGLPAAAPLRATVMGSCRVSA